MAVRSAGWRGDAGAAFVMAVVWVVLAMIVYPAGDFPLNDDWSYGRTVKILVEEHRFHLDGWSSPTFAFQALWGALFCQVFGFSFTALRISTLVLGVAGVIGLYYLLREVSVRRQWAVIGSLALMLNPVYFVNSFSFMTDVPFTVLVILASLFMVRALKSGSGRDELIGFVLLLCATLIRQLTPPIALAYGLAALAGRKFTWRGLARAMYPTAGVLAVYVVYKTGMAALGMTPSLQGAQQQEAMWRIAQLGYLVYARFVFANIYTCIAYLSVFVLPLSVVFACTLLVRGRAAGEGPPARSGWVLAPLAILGAFALYVVNDRNFFFMGNSLDRSLSVGDCDLHHCPVLQYLYGLAPLAHGAAAAAYFAVLMSGCFVLAAVRSGRPRRATLQSYEFRVALFAFLACIGTTAPFALIKMVDRYLLPAVPFAILLFTALGTLMFRGGQAAVEAPVPRNSVVLSLALPALGLLGFVSVVGTHDRFEWNRARWRALSDLMQQRKAAPEDIDGGFPFTGWYLYDKDETLRRRWKYWYTLPVPFFARDTTYLVEFTVKGAVWAGCEGLTVATYPFSAWMLPRRLEVQVVQRNVDAVRSAGCGAGPP